MAERPPKSWKYPGCKGRFYCRGKSNIIWYDLNHKPIGLSLPYSKYNRDLLGKKIAQLENPTIKLTDDAPRTIVTAYELYLKEAVNQKASRTILNYNQAIAAFFENDMPLHCDSIRFAVETEIKRMFRENKYNKTTINTYLSKIKAIFNVFQEKKWIDENPVNKRMFLKTIDKPIDIWTTNELTTIYDYYDRKDKYMFHFIDFLHKTAFRLNEAYYLKWSQVKNNDDWQTKIIFPSKLKDKLDSFPISDNIIKILSNFDTGKHDYVFKEFLPLSMAYNFKIMLNDTGIPKHLYNYNGEGNGRLFHTFRKTRITEWLFKFNLSPAIVSRLARDNINTIMKYYAQFDESDFVRYIDL